MEETKKNINYTFKLLYALGIIFICAGHCQNGGFSIFYEFFPPYSFHLGLFMFASGYFYKLAYENNLKDFIIKKCTRLLIPLFLWNIFYGIIYSIIEKWGFFNTISVPVNFKTIFEFTIYHGQQFVLNRGGWYIIPLFMVHIANLLVRKIFRLLKIEINEFVYFAVCLGLGALGIFLSQSGFTSFWKLALLRFLYFVPFYSAGILYKKYENFDKMNSILYFSLIIITALALIYRFNGMPTVLPGWANFHTSNVILPFAVGFLGIAFWLRVAKILTPALGQNKYVNLIADNTYSIMINQFLGMFLVGVVFALIHKYTIFCSNFDMTQFKTDVYYHYLPYELDQMLIIYLVAGIVFSIYLQKFVSFLWVKILKLKDYILIKITN